MSSFKDKVNEKEPAVDAGITRVQNWLEQLKVLPNSAWVLFVTGVLMLAGGLWLWFS